MYYQRCARRYGTDTVFGVADIRPLILRRYSFDSQAFIVQNMRSPDRHFPVVSSPENLRGRITAYAASEFRCLISQDRLIRRSRQEEWLH